MRDDFAVFILSHGRANNVKTLPTLRECGYTGKVYIVIDDMDDQEADYRAIYGDSVIQFCKADIARNFDGMDLDKDWRSVFYARNACFEIAQRLGLTYFLELDDDYNQFRFRLYRDYKLIGIKMHDLDRIIDAMIEFLETSGALTVAMSQGGDFIGGIDSSVWKKQLARKAMNAFFCKTDRPFKFLGRINEDVNTYTLLGSQGKLLFTVAKVSINQMDTQTNAGGMTDLYINCGTYTKSFFTVMCMPSAVHVHVLNTPHPRIHHQVNWERCVPKIISDRYRKPRKGV